jgi:hypothetical protein
VGGLEKFQNQTKKKKKKPDGGREENKVPKKKTKNREAPIFDKFTI